MASDAALDDHQRFVLLKFRRSVSDVTQPHHDDRFLLRWLRARSWNPEAAEKMLRESLKWRQQWGVDEALKNWQPPESLILFFPCGMTGYDKDGAPVVVVPFGGLDVVGLLHAFGKQEIMKITIQTLEKYMDLAAENNSHKVTVIIDMEGWSIRQYTWRPAAEVIISLIQMYEANYPEILKACYIINAPTVFAIAFNVIKKFLNEYTIGKMHIFKNDPRKWKKIILEHIDQNNLPRHYGGNLTDPDGNPRYSSVVIQGGKVPKHLYRRHFEQNPEFANTKHYETAVVKKGDKLTLDFTISKEGFLLKWDFRTEDHDIRFGITMKDNEGNMTTVIENKRRASHQIDVFGVIECQAPATYTITFDNSYSLMRSKKLHYDITVTSPLEKLNMLSPDITSGEGTQEIAATSVQA